MKKLLLAAVLVLIPAFAGATVSSETMKVQTACNGVTTTFAYTFKIFSTSEIKVMATTAAGVETTLVLTTDYSVTGAGDAGGGNVVLVDAATDCPSGSTLTLIRNLPYTQSTDYVEGEAFPADSHENTVDKLTMQVQQVKEAVGRSFKVPTTSTLTGTNTEVVPVANEAVCFNSGATGITTCAAVGGGTDDQTAAEVVSTPAGNLAADDVQEALNELDTEKVNTTDVIGIAQGGTGEALVDPAADTLMGWDNTDNDIRFVTIGAGLAYDAGTDTISATGGAGLGDVVGPAGDVATDNGVVRFHLTTGEAIQESLATLSDTGTFNIPAGETYNIDGSPHAHAGTAVTFTPVGTIAASDVETAIAEVATDAAVATSITSGQLNIARMPACSAQYQMLVCDASLEPQYTDVFPLDTLDDSAVTFVDDGDPTKQLAFQLSGVTTATTRTLTISDRDGTIALERPYEVIKTANANITLAEVGGTLISNYGETDDADLILTLPDLDDYPGANFIYRISTAMATNDTCVKAAADNAFMLGGSAGAANGCICNAGPTLGDKLTCAAWTTAAGEVVIDCEATRGTWAIVADNTGDCPN